ncbi:MAG: excinuclease ABC subunit UvrC [Candidatus Thiodiazotropha sp. (ex Lucina aurantia)]|uniref:UvrABC system protein C n=1 Tax=Candidatus Thiodiazotropha endolucinida TaxID=1655433 RepID=A0A7Z0VND3_9GAMM|nr:excinuclease ABC subunit UvrC [Candidatus Thiodiazotropha endolucinida]MBT3011311.1 excinuclease ABC subunit UvrC [Candidatus Thiodiazotropha sp. (ex Lucina pensylvanica)]MBT3023259.1 excinuclease ABC subunit UvrC [Candidatus Thiodiazotropha taylori]MBT3051518.1 excinuclease ABC subunit UvrC [Candidatus Thiodiazotropha sp. (ex Codakia orbicularis)]MBV2103036.1 excinuclease ABC subunit UvrC [Candidatus Thiodiazotropha sp. (ex Lucina aurantia)]MBT3030377.1 excinuclease ABC subunit UvrC [Candi
MQQNEFDHTAFLKTLTTRPGVYRMVNAEGNVLYVGKARNLKKRVSSYFTRSLNRRIQIMVGQIAQIEVIVTHTEAEALLLENHLIKSLKPKYNVLLRDDKSYPYIYLSTDHTYPALSFRRGARRGKGRYFGPYPSAGSTRETLQVLQKLFPVRQCEESFFRNRSRACLQYQIKRCSGPCVGLISTQAYGEDVQHAVLFLEGKTSQVVDELVAWMERASGNLDFEQAAIYRDQIKHLRRIQERQYVSGEGGDLDIVALAKRGGSACIQVFYIRSGRNLGNKSFYPSVPRDATDETILQAFVSQYYLEKPVPNEIILNHRLAEKGLLEEVLSQQAERRVRISSRVRGERARWLKMAQGNAELALQARLSAQAGMEERLQALQQALQLPAIPERMECFDISHTRGESTVASCVVFNEQGPLKSDYRRFNIEDITPGDDYAAMAQALERRYRRVKKGEVALPDILFIDGGKGQIGAVHERLQDLGISGLTLVGVAKGADRKVGQEQLFLLGRRAPFILPADSPALHLIQQIRDEAHRFAITAHRQRRSKSRNRSVLEQIPGIGPKRRQRLMKQFGGLQELSRAGIEDISRVEGISTALAEQIYHAFHDKG